MLFDFFQYLYTINNNNVSEYFNCYSTFLLTQKDLKENVLKHRMDFLINYYATINSLKKNKYDYYYYYLNNYKDDYLNKPLLKYEPVVEIKDDDLYDDVKDHYKFITTPNPPKEVIDYDELDEKYYLEEEEKNNLEENNNYFDDDYYEDDYYEDEYDYENDYDDIDEY